MFAGVVQSQVVIETVRVGNPGNRGKLTGTEETGIPKGPGQRITGSVNHIYRIGKFEVTTGQYADFLNAVASPDTYELYDSRMWSEPQGCHIERRLSRGTYSYVVASDWTDRPVNYVSWGDAVRFANWLHNGQPVGAQDLSTTEDGSYYVNGALSQGDLMAVNRNPDASWVLPTVDEWYKAAYHHNDGVTVNYYEYATRSDSVPGCVTDDFVHSEDGTAFIEGGGDPGNYATWDCDGISTTSDFGGIGSPYYRTNVGEWELSGSPYGTFDQNGNIDEWTESPFSYGDGSELVRAIQGESYRNSNEYRMRAISRRGGNSPEYGRTDRGFRVAEFLPACGDGPLEYESFHACLAGPAGGPLADLCRCADIDLDNDVELADFAAFQLEYTVFEPIVIETVPVGNPGNPGEISGADDTARVTGSVPYDFSMGKFEITAGQYAAFLNAVASMGDTHGLYHEDMANAYGPIWGCNIQRGPLYQGLYSVEPDWADRPVNFVSWGDAARFANWMHNGQPRGRQDLTTTEDGSYFLDGATTSSELMDIQREPDATWVIPSEDEWYKAAYHNGMKAPEDYYDYPTGSDTAPGCLAHGPVLSGSGDPFVEGGFDPGNYANHNCDGNSLGLGDPLVRSIGGEWENSLSPYGTADQGGNVQEWIEQVHCGDDVTMGDPAGTCCCERGVRGGSTGNNESWMRAGERDFSLDATVEYMSAGFRLAKLPSE